MIKKILENILEYIWPQFCLNCKKEGSLLCSSCSKKILNSSKLKKEDNCYICLEYNRIDNIVKEFKYHYLENLSNIFIDILYKQAKELNIDYITNIPLHKKKKKQRGFDQTEILTKGLAKKLNKPYYPLLKKIKNTKAQAKLNKKERILNLNNAFKKNKDINISLDNKTILIVDDITTTGTTLKQASQVLEKENCNILCLVLAKNID